MTPTLQISTYTKRFKKKKVFTYLLSDLGLICTEFEAFGGLIPVSAHSLRRQLYLLLILAHELAQTKVGYLDFSLVEDYVLRFQIVVDYLLFLIAQVLQSGQYLRDD